MTKTKPAPRPAVSARRPFHLGAGVMALVLGLLVLAFFHEVMLEGKTFSSPDAQAPAGFVTIGERSLSHDHVYPLWNPYVFLGMPSFASGSYNPYLYPPDWLFVPLKVIPIPGLTWMILYYFLAAWFAALLAREWGARPEGALLAGIVFAFTPNLVAVGSHGHGSQLVDSAYLPLIVWLASRWYRRGGIHHLGWLALAGGCQMLRGHAQIVYYTWLAVGIYVAVELVTGFVRKDADAPPVATRLLRAGGILAAMLLSFGMAGVYNLPLRDYAKQSIRGGGADGGVGMDYATAWSLAPWELPTLIAPNAVGFGGATYWGGMPFTDYPNIYVGIAALVLAIFGLLRSGTTRIYAWALAGFSLLVAFGEHTPFYGMLYRGLPLFNKFRVPVMIVLLMHLAIALAVAWGWSRALDSAPAPVARPRGAAAAPSDPALMRLALAIAAVLAIALLAAAFAGESLQRGYEASALVHRPEIGAQAAAVGASAYVRDLTRLAFVGLVTVGLVLLVRRRALPALPATAIVAVLLLFDLWPVSRQLVAPVIANPADNSIEVGRDDVIDSLEARARTDLFRVAPVEEFRSNRFTGFGIQSVGGYHAAKPRIAQDLFDRNSHLAALQMPGAPPRFPWLELLNAKYLITQQPLESAGLTVAFPTRSGRVYEVPNVLPRATVLGRYRVAPFDSTLIDGIASGAVDARTTTTLATDPHLTLGPVEGARALVTVYKLNTVTVEVETPGPALVRLADLWAPDWKATVDGHPAEILRADYLLRVVAVPAGRHTIVFRYQPVAVRNGLMVSLASFALVLVLIVIGVITGRRRPVAEAEAA